MFGAHLGTYGESMVTTQAARIAQAVAAEMRAVGMTTLGLAEATSIPRSTLQRRLRTGAGFEIQELFAIADALGTTVKELISKADRAA